MKQTICRLISTALIIYFSIAAYGHTKNWITATCVASLLWSLWMLGYESKRHGIVEKGVK